MRPSGSCDVNWSVPVTASVDTLHGGKQVVVVVVSDAAANGRHWLITAYIARKLAQGDVEWTRS